MGSMRNAKLIPASDKRNPEMKPIITKAIALISILPLMRYTLNGSFSMNSNILFFLAVFLVFFLLAIDFILSIHILVPIDPNTNI
ncbi:hypothetical protein CAXC1_260057 [Candidatus Xenohaliotis californiensis]|uniref:Uncharacterized protein n=1 Tax=Candidatus Xenohaliotis californiensis TaxID=84677 RepID=A0ABP0EW22_9RICK|nr:hypothetical protein CAXC1_260057 [Candidatus Xenohaliotis californiensis]